MRDDEQGVEQWRWRVDGKATDATVCRVNRRHGRGRMHGYQTPTLSRRISGGVSVKGPRWGHDGAGWRVRRRLDVEMDEEGIESKGLGCSSLRRRISPPSDVARGVRLRPRWCAVLVPAVLRGRGRPAAGCACRMRGFLLLFSYLLLPTLSQRCYRRDGVRAGLGRPRPVYQGLLDAGYYRLFHLECDVCSHETTKPQARPKEKEARAYLLRTKYELHTHMYMNLRSTRASMSIG